MILFCLQSRINMNMRHSHSSNPVGLMSIRAQRLHTVRLAYLVLETSLAIDACP